MNLLHKYIHGPFGKFQSYYEYWNYDYSIQLDTIINLDLKQPLSNKSLSQLLMIEKMGVGS